MTWLVLPLQTHCATATVPVWSLGSLRPFVGSLWPVEDTRLLSKMHRTGLGFTV